MIGEDKIVVLGGGESGVGAAVLAQKKGFDVFLSDNNEIQEKYRSVLTHFDIDFEENGHNLSRLQDAKQVIKSPGIPDSVQVIRTLKASSIPIISEIEFAGNYTNAKTICITGSNGKTTTTLLTHHILKNAGLKVGLAGNIGKSFAMQVAEEDYDIYVLEISSFQLDGMFNFKADIAILMNITPDHLDRYEYSFQKYVNSKFRIVQNQTNKEALIYCYDDPVILDELSKRSISSKLYPFSLKELKLEKGAYINKNQLIIKSNKTQFNMTLEQLALQGKHNVYNSMAAGVAAKVMDIRNENVKQSLSDFHNIPHRLEHVANVHGIRFLNDSKATNVNSSWYALEYIDKPIVWIAGGIDKGNDYSSIRPLVIEKVRAIVCIGVDNKKLHDEFGDIVDNIVDTTSMDVAVVTAYHIANKGESVLLSPACASFDLFENYEERGNQFKKAVNAL